MTNVASFRPRSGARSALFALLAAAGLTSVACGGGNANANLKEAHEEAAEERREKQEDNAELARKQRDNNTEHSVDQSNAQAGGRSSGEKKVAEAHNEMFEQRKKFQSEAKERLDKADAKLGEARTKAKIGGTKTPTSASSSIDTATSQRNQVAQDIAGLDSVPDDAFETSKDSVKKKLDELDSLVDVALDKSKKR